MKELFFQKDNISVHTEELTPEEFKNKYQGYKKIPELFTAPTSQEVFYKQFSKFLKKLDKKNIDYSGNCYVDCGVTKWIVSKVITGVPDQDYGETPKYILGYNVYAGDTVIKSFPRSEFKVACKFAREYTETTFEATVIKKEPVLTEGSAVITGYFPVTRESKNFPGRNSDFLACTEKHLYVIIKT